LSPSRRESILLGGRPQERLLRHGSARPAPPHARFSLAPLVAHWKRLLDSDGPERDEAQALMAALELAPDLKGPLEDVEVLQNQRALAEAIVSALIPSVLTANNAIGLARPFTMELAFATPRFRQLLLNPGSPLRLAEQYRAAFDTMQPIAPYLHILEKLYAIEVPPLESAYILSRTDEGSGLEEHFQILLGQEFVTVRPRGELPPVPAERLAALTESFSRPDELFAALPLDAFVFEGFTVIRCSDITLQEAENQLRDALVSNDLLDVKALRVIEKRFRSVVRIPGLKMLIGVAAGGCVYFATSPTAAGSILQGLEECAAHAFETLRRQAVERAGAFVIDDLSAIDVPESLAWLAGSGGSLLLAPLQQNTGLLVLGSPLRNDFSALTAIKISSLVPLITRCVRRAHDTINLHVQAVIKERYTSIHPAVEWRFREAVWSHLRNGGALDRDIVFPEVYPLFGVSDIRSSSVLRNRAVQGDLLEQVELGLKVLRASAALEQIDMVDRLVLELDDIRARLDAGLTSGEEMIISEFLKREMEPILARLETQGESVRVHVQNYRSILDPNLGALYRRRRDFDRSLTAIADCIAAIVDRGQTRIQRLFPHYFEMHRSDGVDHGMYVGQSLLPPGIVFDEVFLRTLRLWQLGVMCESARACEALRESLAMPLETTHLVLVQHSPLAIRFSSSEKQFTVEGAYNARYEIVKKRLDKAEIRGTGERLTQPARLAIVYAHPREAEEYRDYLRYLARRGQIGEQVEELELGELPGVRGLQALRVDVRTDGDPADLATAELQLAARTAR
jgi:hypothetical protein